jgi:hypothetical protein
MRMPILMMMSCALLSVSCGSRDADEDRKGRALLAPKRKAGLWEERRAIAGLPLRVSRLCLDDFVEGQLLFFASQVANAACRQSATAARDGRSWTFTTSCNLGPGGVQTTTGVASGDLSSAYRVQANSTVAGAAFPSMNGSIDILIEAVRLGACPRSMKFGDEEVNGLTINILAE